MVRTAIGRYLDRQIVDETGLTGSFRGSLNYTPGLSLEPGDVSIFTAVREEFGLALEPATRPVDVVVVDSIDRPTPD